MATGSAASIAAPPIASTARTKRRHAGHCDTWTATTRCSAFIELAGGEGQRGVLPGDDARLSFRFFQQILQAVHRQPDSRFHGAQRNAKRFSDLRMWPIFYKRHPDRGRLLASKAGKWRARSAHSRPVLTICVSCEFAGSAKYSSSASGTATPARADRRTASIRRLRAIVNIQAGAPAEAGSNCAAFRHTASRVSCAISSASSPLAPAFSIRPLTRGAKCSNSSLKASRSPCAAIRPIKSAHSTFALGLSLSYFRNGAGRNDGPIVDPKDFLTAWEPRVIAPRRELMDGKRRPAPCGSPRPTNFLAFRPGHALSLGRTSCFHDFE